jgi:DNA-binding FrmR family transcriptional regulator
MAHTSLHKKKHLDRIRRIRGQVNAVEKAIDEGRECGEVLLTLAACRGAVNSLMAEIMEGHVRHHLLPQDVAPSAKTAQAAEELIDVIKRYLK